MQEVYDNQFPYQGRWAGADVRATSPGILRLTADGTKQVAEPLLTAYLPLLFLSGFYILN